MKFPVKRDGDLSFEIHRLDSPDPTPESRPDPPAKRRPLRPPGGAERAPEVAETDASRNARVEKILAEWERNARAESDFPEGEQFGGRVSRGEYARLDGIATGDLTTTFSGAMRPGVDVDSRGHSTQPVDDLRAFFELLARLGDALLERYQQAIASVIRDVHQ